MAIFGIFKKNKKGSIQDIKLAPDFDAEEQEIPADILAKVSEEPEKEKKKTEDKKDQEEELFTCTGCNEQFPVSEMKRNLYVCPKCGKHHKISARRRIRGLVDPGTFRRLRCDVSFIDPLGYPDYEDKIKALKEKTGLDEGVLAGVGEIEGHKAVIAVMGSEFLMGSMGIAVGEKITNAFEVADKLNLPIIIFTASGGARMQEGILSLMQMAKTSAAAKKFSENGGLYIAVETHPTTGGVSASFATLADITLAEPGALIGFAGPRVIEQTIGQKLPEGFQRAEYLQDHGFIDGIVNRNDMRDELSHILSLHIRRRRPTL
ncbi:MAG: acetyl-CoA carboxylase carboxyltransferase subunit beta [Eubacterium sp.]|nr:acetyl-CoA carboxylase carboxyltransferase subunit beta [Eubacterium sp.]